MDTILVATPLRHPVSKPYTFSSGVSIRQIQPILWELSVTAKRFTSEDERQYLSQTGRYWLSVSKKAEEWYLNGPDHDLYDQARRAMSAMQIMCPVGGRNTFWKFCETAEGFDNIGSFHPSKMESTVLGNIAVLDEQELQDSFDRVHEGVNRAFDELIIRLENPIALLEHGLQTSHIYLSTMMWVMGLDMLFMAGTKKAFVERIAGFLGSNTQVFPVVSSVLKQQPSLTVGEILNDLYDLRSKIAHGDAIPAKFRRKFDLVDTHGATINSQDYSYSQVLLDSALFLLVKSLKQIMTAGLVDAVKDEPQWRRILRNC